MEIKKILESGLPSFIFEIEQSVKEGWEVCKENTPTIAWQYECTMIRETPIQPVAVKPKGKQLTATL
jgi:hypothetical protein